jgi:hypothetical protein
MHPCFQILESDLDTNSSFLLDLGVQVKMLEPAIYVHEIKGYDLGVPTNSTKLLVPCVIALHREI